MPAERILLAALSARALAQSARAGGLAPVVLDGFGDLDAREAATALTVIPLDDDWRFERAALLAAAVLAGPAPLIYGSGFERHPDLLEALAADRPLLGTAPADLRRAKDPMGFAATLAALGVPHPETRNRPPAAPAGWLAKRPGGAGGGHVRPAGPGHAANAYWQRAVAGEPVSVLVAGDGRRALALAGSAQWHDPTPGRPFRYGGAAAPVGLSAGLLVAAERVAAAFALRGLGSVDALLDGEEFSVLELNPRPGAALDAYERAFGVSLVAAHVAACRGKLAPLPPARCAAAARLVWAQARSVIPARLRWPTWSADRGAPGQAVPAGGPIATVLGEGLTVAEAREVAETRALTLLARLARHAQRAG